MQQLTPELAKFARTSLAPVIFRGAQWTVFHAGQQTFTIKDSYGTGRRMRYNSARARLVAPSPELVKAYQDAAERTYLENLGTTAVREQARVNATGKAVHDADCGRTDGTHTERCARINFDGAGIEATRLLREADAMLAAEVRYASRRYRHMSAGI